MKFLLVIFIIVSSFLNVNGETFIEEETNDIYIENIFNEIKLNKNIELWKTLNIDLSSIEKELEEKYSSKIIFKWDLKWTTTKKWNIFEKVFEKDWNKEISLSIYSEDKKEEKLITTKKYNLFVYKNKISLIIDNENIDESKINSYILKAENNWTYIHKIVEANEKNLKNKKISQNIFLNLSNKEKNENSYIMVWWDKNYIFSVISKLNKEIDNHSIHEKLNLVLVSPFNTDVLNNYLRNFVSNKPWIKSILLLPESSMSQIWLNSNNIVVLENSLKNKEYEYINVNIKSKISEVLFISNFVNKLSNSWFSNHYIYLIILISFLFTWISLFKHLLWLSPIWITIPIVLTLLLFQVWIIVTWIIVLSLIIINLFLWKITNKYTLLYTPKISFILIINIVIIILLLNLLLSYNLININITDSLFIILFILVSERLITIILSKEFSEYKYNLLNTIIFAVISFLILNIWTIQTLILAYPEVIIFLIPINFIIWKFTWLRVTEYFRFKEVIKSIEE